MPALEDFLVGAHEIDHFGLEHVWGFNPEEKYAFDLIEAISGTALEATNPKRPTLRSLAFRYVAPSNSKTEAWWTAVATAVKQHSTIDSVSFAFTRKKPMIAHNLMERHYDSCPEVLERLLIAIGSNPRLKRVQLESVGLTAEDAKPIIRILKRCKTLVRLCLPRNSLGRQGAESLAKHLRSSKHLEELDLSGNNMGDMGAIAIILACADHPTVNTLSISSNDLTSAVLQPLCSLVEGSIRLRSLDISYNFIGRGIISLLRSVSDSQTLQELNIAYNAGTESCVGAIKHLVARAPPGLLELNLAGNQLPPEAGVVIRHALKENTIILHVNMESNFLHRNDVVGIEQSLAANREQAAFKFRWEPKRLVQKWNFATLKSLKARSVAEKKVLLSRSEADRAVDDLAAKEDAKEQPPKPCSLQ